ncbi:tetraacyldisaccharide 4'-kinase [Haemophilus paracuniculus]|uniref:UPF0434 protein B0187_08850 n=1 Tax=Haemophilus paracuniculus TaxID=734 RepID=A0A1T0AQC2_9PAST|nr:Trm112 family protein [Haemophilus paracuniculus]OOR98367.1 tetraacyldisaccharide 4'-kinase [Haemophilus paracuniculus]
MNEKLVALLACPLSNGKLEWDKTHNRLISPQAKVAYPIVNGIPVLLPEQAQPLDGAEQNAN